MSLLGNILSRLHGVFNKDPKRHPVLIITATDQNAQVSVTNLRLFGTGGMALDLSEITLQDLVTAISATPGYSAALISSNYGAFLARGILDDGSHGVLEDPNLYFPMSQLWAEMQTYAWILEEQTQRLRQISKQLYFHSSDTDWLDYWANGYFGCVRNIEEQDEGYLRRAVQEIVAPNQNNIALENMVEKALEGSSCQVIDSAADPDRLIEGKRPLTWFQVLVGFNLDTGEVSFDGKTEQTLAIINRAKAAGTRIEYFEMAGHLTAPTATVALGAAIAVTEVIEVFPSSSLAYEDDDDIITEDGDDLMK